MSSKKSTIHQLTLIALMTSLLCILSPLTLYLPISPVPITLSFLAIYFTIYLLGMKKATLSVIIYLLIGLVGIPVFSGFSAGPGKLLGPTGGYLIGYIFMPLISGYFIDKKPSSRPFCFLGLLCGTIACYLFGTVWLAFQAGLTFPAALAAGVLPFIPGDLVKIALALLIAPQIRSRLVKADLT